jgi:putative zinc-dependent peptidase DUF5700
MLAFLLTAALMDTAARVDVRLVTDEADAVLNILDKRAANTAIPDADWQRLFTSEGFVRLKKRENSMQRAFDEKLFREFALSTELLKKRKVLARTLADWKQADLTHAARLALAYLPANATIHAKVYPVIKPKSNSFVFEVDSDPAIFKYVEDEPRQEFERTMSHEMHHVGYGTACRAQAAIPWVGAFGEGFAVLAAAGGPDKPPQGKLMKVWNEEMAKFNENFRNVGAFFLDVAEGRLTGDAVDKRAFEFFGMLGPWYTVGWKMDVVIETTLGRPALIDAMCDQRTLLATYNRAAGAYEQRTGETLPRWSTSLVEFLSSPSSGTPARSPR